MENTKPVMTDHCVDISSSVEPLEEEPDQERLLHLLEASMLALDLPPSEVSVRFVSATEIQSLNQQYRGIDRPTNVLSFESDLELPADSNAGYQLLGDIVICNEVVADEAHRYGKSMEARTTHMLVHGLLHLLGYDHEIDTERQAMEKLEVKLMSSLGFSDPFEMDTSDGLPQ